MSIGTLEIASHVVALLFAVYISAKVRRWEWQEGNEIS
jgi:hypothetical protein